MFVKGCFERNLQNTSKTRQKKKKMHNDIKRRENYNNYSKDEDTRQTIVEAGRQGPAKAKHI